MAGANIKINTNSSQSDKALKDLQRQFKNLQGEFSLASTKAKLFGTETDKLTVAQKELSSKVKIGASIVSTHREAIYNANKEINKAKLEQQELGKKIEEVTKAHKKSVEETGKNSEESKKLSEEIRELKEREAAYGIEIEKANKQLENKKKQLNYAESALLKNKKALEDVSSEIENMKFNKVADGIEKVSDKVSKLGKGVSVFSAGVIGVGVASVASFNEVDNGMDNVKKATGAVGDTVKELEESYKNVASSIVGDFGEIGSALGEANTRFGFTGEKLEECTMKFLKFAEVNNTDATTSVQLVARAMGDAGIESDNYSMVLDQLTKAAQNTGININKLTEMLTKYGAPMRALGFDTKEAIAIFSQWELAGVNTEIAFSGMKQAIGKWGKEGKDARKEFKKVLEEIEKAPNIAQATSRSIEIFGQKAGPDLADAIQGGRFEFGELLKTIEGADGTVDNTFNGLRDGSYDAKEAIQNVKLASSELGQEIVSAAAPSIQIFSEKIKEASKWFAGLDEGTKNIILGIGGFIAVLGPLLIGIGAIGKGISNTIRGFRDFKGAITSTVPKVKDFVSKASNASKSVINFSKNIASKGITSIKKFGGAILSGAKNIGTFTLNLLKSGVQLGIQGVKAGISTGMLIAHKAAILGAAAATKIMTLAQGALNLVMSLNPITLIIGGLIALGAVFVVLYNKCEWFRNGVASIWTTITNIFSVFDNFLTGIFTTDWTNSFGAFGNILNAFFANCSNIWDSIKGVFKGIVDFVAGIFTGDWSRAWEGVKGIFSNIMNGLGAVIKAPLNTVIGLINMAIDGLNKISFTVPDWVPLLGGKHFGVNLPKMNYLYNGGIITKPTLLNANTIVGDKFQGQGSQAEAVIPLEAMYRKLRRIIKEESTLGEIILYTTNIFKVDSKEVVKETTKQVIGKIGRSVNNHRKGKGGVAFA